MIYLDNCATTRPRPEVVAAVERTMAEEFGNPSSLHRLGLRAEKLVKEARNRTADFLKVQESEIYFTSGGTESNNIVVQGIASIKSSKGKHIVTTSIEHPAVMNTLKYLEKKGFEITWLRNDHLGKIDIGELKESLRDDTILVTVIHVNNEVGIIQDIEEIGKALSTEKSKPHFHLDGVQSFAKLPLSLKAWGVDSYAFSGHKLHGPKGIGGLYLDSKVNLPPLLFGGNQERGLRSGTENVPGIVGLSTALSFVSKDSAREFAHVNNLKSLMIELLIEGIPEIKINSPVNPLFSPYILNVSIPWTRGEIMVHSLEDKDIYVSTTSACSSKGKSKSHVLEAIGLDDKCIEGTLRISFSHENTEDDIRIAAREITNAAVEIRSIMRR